VKSDAKKSILILCPFFLPNIGGAETHLNDLSSYLSKRGYRVYVVTYQPLTTKVRAKTNERVGDIEIHRIWWFGNGLFHRLERYFFLEFFYLTPMLFLGTITFMLRNNTRVNIIHAHGFNAAFVAKFVAKIFKKKGVASTHAIYNLRERPLLAKLVKWVLSSFNTVLVLSEASRAELENIGLNKNRLRTYTHWIDQMMFRPLDKQDCKKKLKLDDKFVVLYVGRLSEGKGVRLLIRVAGRFGKVKNDINFVFVGHGQLHSEVESAARNLENVKYLGIITGNMLAEVYNAADLFVLPSVVDEGFGRVVPEALSCGIPVIVTRKGGIPEAVGPQVGILVEPDVNIISETIISLYNSPEKLRALACNCRKYAEQHFSESNARLIEKSYPETLFT